MAAKGLVRRWLAFNGVGTIGVALQLAVLAMLTRGVGLHPLIATAIAVEAAILHNFLWHQRWTWRDRPSRSARVTAARLLRFHTMNGAISMVGNLTIVAILTPLGIRALPANAVAIAVCSLANFVASETIVFRAARVAAILAIAIAVPIATPISVKASGPADMATAELTAATVSAWQQYERQVDERYNRAPATSQPYFAQDAFKSNATSSWRRRVVSGEVSMSRIDTPSPGQATVDIPDGKVHHWVGAVFIPRAKLETVLAQIKDRAGRESESFSDVIGSRLLSRDGDRIRIFLKLRRDNIITVTYNTEHEVQYRPLGPARASSRSVATKIAELDDAGTPREREKPVGNDHGFLWRLNAYWRFEQTDDGVIIECESASLSRGVPALLRVFVSGTVERIARESLHNTLASLKKTLTR